VVIFFLRPVPACTRLSKGPTGERGPAQPGHSFGLGFGVRTQAGIAPFSGSVGQFFWSGMGGTFFWIDPKEDLFVIFMSQAPGQRVYTRTLVRNLVYAAME
jgi:CubicO group peptidase (beta-lactamase class C family)